MSVPIGETLPGFILPAITQAQVNGYLDASGDDNPLHRDAELASSVGLAGIPVPGMLVMGQLAECAQRWPRCAAITRLSARFVSIILVGSALEIAGRVVAAGDDPDEAILRLTARQDGKIAVLGEARIRLRDA